MVIKINKRAIAYFTGVLISVAVLVALVHPLNKAFHAHGPMNVGHEELKCENCHLESIGTFRQQLQANTKYLLGLRQRSVTIGFEKINNAVCITCHDRPTDDHPVYRFMEPKFSKVRAKIKPQICTSCHIEHTSTRVSVSKEFCKHCHEELQIKDDVLTTTHASLVKRKRWNTCLGCHDYHGNHVMTLNDDDSKILSDSLVDNYFRGSLSPYSAEKKYKAKESL